MGFKVAVVGATGNVGREMLNVLDERKFDVSDIAAVASSRGARITPCPRVPAPSGMAIRDRSGYERATRGVDSAGHSTDAPGWQIVGSGCRDRNHKEE